MSYDVYQPQAEVRKQALEKRKAIIAFYRENIFCTQLECGQALGMSPPLIGKHIRKIKYAIKQNDIEKLTLYGLLPKPKVKLK